MNLLCFTLFRIKTTTNNAKEVALPVKQKPNVVVGKQGTAAISAAVSAAAPAGNGGRTKAVARGARINPSVNTRTKLTMKKWTKGGLDWEHVKANHVANDFNQCNHVLILPIIIYH